MPPIPRLILCDEVTSALDTVVGAAILDLLAELRRELGVSYMFISHDISTVRAICDEVIVLYAGHRVEAGQRDVLAAPPYHPYTELLVDSVPALKPGWLDARREIGADRVAADGAECRYPRAVRIPGALSGAYRRNVQYDAAGLKKLPSGAEILCHHPVAELNRLQTVEATPA